MDKLMDPLHLKPVANDVALRNLFQSNAFRALFIISLLVGLAATVITYWALDTQHPYDFVASESYVVPYTARGNDQMIVKWRVVAHRTCPGLIRRELIDPKTDVVLAVYDPQIAAPKYKLEDGYLNKVFMMPRSVQPGMVGYRSHLEYWCNPLQRLWPLRYDTPTLLFEVK